MANVHFRDKLLKDLVDKSAPNQCPKADCSYQTSRRNHWTRHYGTAHGYIKKYLGQYIDENHGKAPPKLATPQNSPTAMPENSLTAVMKDHTNEEDHSKSPHITIKLSNNPKVKETIILRVTVQTVLGNVYN